MKNTIIKLNTIIDNSLKTHQKGEKFFDKIDDELKNPRNEDIIISLFEKIYNDFGFQYNMVISGGFSENVQHLIKHGKIVCKGNILQVSGSLTSHKGEMGKITKHKELYNISQKSDISNQDFIFVDDSYFSGTTEKMIDQYLNNFGSKIIKTYVIYDGGLKNDRVISLYRYFDHNTGVKKPVEVLLDYLYRLKDIPYDIYEEKIVKGEIKTLFELKNQINKFHNKVRSNIYINPFKHNESVQTDNHGHGEEEFLMQIYSDLSEEFGYQLHDDENRFFKKGEILPEGYEIRFGMILRRNSFCEVLKSDKIGISYYLKPNEDTYLIEYYSWATKNDRQSYLKLQDNKEEIEEYLEGISSILKSDGYRVTNLVNFNFHGSLIQIVVQKNSKVIESKIMNWNIFLESKKI